MALFFVHVSSCIVCVLERRPTERQPAGSFILLSRGWKFKRIYQPTFVELFPSWMECLSVSSVPSHASSTWGSLDFVGSRSMLRSPSTRSDWPVKIYIIYPK